MKKTLTAALLLLLAAAPLSAQKRAETKLYQKTLSKPSVEAFDKFLKRYPTSVYAEEILARKDTLLNISPYDERQAAAIAAERLPAGIEVRALADRREAVDRVYAICLEGEGLGLDQVRIVTFRKDADEWAQEGVYDAPAADAEGMSVREFVDETSVVAIRGTRYLFFHYLLSGTDGQAYVAAAYAPQTDEFGCVSFRGKDIRGTGHVPPYHILGRSDEALLSGMDRPWMRLLLKDIQDNPWLEYIPENIYLTDAALEWWLKQNPDALIGLSDVCKTPGIDIDDFDVGIAVRAFFVAQVFDLTAAVRAAGAESHIAEVRYLVSVLAVNQSYHISGLSHLIITAGADPAVFRNIVDILYGNLIFNLAGTVGLLIIM